MPTRENKSNAAGRSEGKPIRQSDAKNSRSSNGKKKTTSISKTKRNSRQVDPSGHERIHDGFKLGSPGQPSIKFNLLVDNVPYLVTSKVYQFNGEKRYRVSINGNEEHIFTWDSDLKRLKAIDDEASTLPDILEEAISTKLQSKS